MGVVRILADGHDLIDGWLTVASEDQRSHVRVCDIRAWSYAVGDGVLNIITPSVTLQVVGTSEDFEVTNELDWLLWTLLVEGART